MRGDHGSSRIARHPIASFVLLAFAISYTAGPATLWLAGAWIRPLSEVGAQYIGGIGVVGGPAVSALIVTYLTEGSSGIARLLSRLSVRRYDWTWIGAVPLLALVVTGLACMATGTSPTAFASVIRDGWALLLAHYVLALVTVGIGEELGWRGWLLPKLLARHRRADATLLVATVWCAWHLPKLLPGGGVALSLVVVSYALSFLFTVLWSGTRGSVLAVALAHASVNAPISFYETALGYDRARAAWFAACGVYAAAAVVLVAARWSWWRSLAGERRSNRG